MIAEVSESRSKHSRRNDTSDVPRDENARSTPKDERTTEANTRNL